MAENRSALEPVHEGRQRLSSRTLARHRHEAGYAALILSGGYEEAGDRGRRQVGAGDVLVHAPFEAHLNRIGRSGAEILNLALPGFRLPGGAGKVRDADRIARLAEKSFAAAARELLAQLEPVASASSERADQLATLIASADPPAITAWTTDHRVNGPALSRAFRRLYGTCPRRFRLEARTQRAWLRLVSDDTPLAAIAAELGFADQSHMTRAVVALTGRTPGAWRRRCTVGSRLGCPVALI